MRALTVRQPWAWAIVYGGKDVENRSRNIAGSYRGPVAIHAATSAAKWSDYKTAAALLGRSAVDLSNALRASDGALIDAGCVIGVVDLVRVHRSGAIMCAPCSPWAEPDAWHLVLANPRPLAHPIPWRGALGLWPVPADLEAQIRAGVTP